MNEDFLEDYKSNVKYEALRMGLQSISEEEQQLLLLRKELNKVKKLREEQKQKDLYIHQLKERIAVLEADREVSNRQNSEIQIIMTERINNLEKYLSEKERVEREYHERIYILETREKENFELQSYINSEKKR